MCDCLLVGTCIMHCIYIVSVYVCVSHKVLNLYIYLVLAMVVSPLLLL